MTQAYVGEIRIFAGNFAPAGWMLCQGQLLPISEYETLFNLIGTIYGGDGQTSFQLPDLRSRVPLHQGGMFVIGLVGGAEQVTLTTSQIPAHSHPLLATSTGQTLAPSGNAIPAVATSTQSGIEVYGPPASGPTTLAPGTIGATGGNQPHNNIQPYLGLNFIISLFGIFPSQT
jgi:microcystin-dependent protein